MRARLEEGGRRRIAGAEAIGAALERGEPLRLIVLDEDRADAAARALVEPARRAGVPVQSVGARHFDRLCPPGAPAPAPAAVALLGEAPPRDLADALSREGPAWLLTGVVYPGNTGMAIRTAEVSGAVAVCVDADFDHAKRREAARASMRADRFIPVLWHATDAVLDTAQQAGRRLVGLEESGTTPPWGADLTGPVLFVVGGEFEGIPARVLARCDAVVRIPMAGFIRSYNLQAAVAVAAAERMRQLDAAGPSGAPE